MVVSQQESNPAEKKLCNFRHDDGKQCPVEAVDNSDFCAQHTEYQHDIVIFQVIHESLLQDLREYWTRTNFYFLVQGALLTAFFTISSSKNTNFSSIKPYFCILGCLIAVIWLLVALLSIYYMNQWRTKMVDASKVIDRHPDPFYAPVVKLAQGPNAHLPNLLTPTGITLLLPVLFAISWLYFLFWFHPS